MLEYKNRHIKIAITKIQKYRRRRKLQKYRNMKENTKIDITEIKIQKY